jgi:hypothetical protein
MFLNEGRSKLKRYFFKILKRGEESRGGKRWGGKEGGSTMETCTSGNS